MMVVLLGPVMSWMLTAYREGGMLVEERGPMRGADDNAVRRVCEMDAGDVWLLGRLPPRGTVRCAPWLYEEAVVRTVPLDTTLLTAATRRLVVEALVPAVVRETEEERGTSLGTLTG